jgi:hypothetical protein
VGIFADTYEDTSEHLGQVYEQTPKGFIRIVHSLASSRSVPVTMCPVCGREIRETLVNQHVRDDHAGNHLYMRINGSVIPPDVHLGITPERIEVVCLGWKAVEATVSIDNTPQGQPLKIAEGITDLTSRIGTIQNVELLFGYRSDNKQWTYTIYVGKQPSFNGSGIDTLAYQMLFKPLHEGTSPDYNRFQRYSAPGNELERKYMNGLCDYALAQELSLEGKPSKQFLERSFSLLESFVTPFAITARSALAFRMNLFSFLKQCLPTSHFYPANQFFNQAKGKLKGKGKVDREYGVFIDHFTVAFLETLTALEKRNYEFVQLKTGELERMVDRLSQNDVDKLSLLRARTAVQLKDVGRARSEYVSLKDNVQFGQEARKYLNG